MNNHELAAALADEDGLSIKVFDGLEDALIGVGHRPGIDPVAIYDEDKIIEILMERDGMSHEDAWDFYGCNIQCLFIGSNTPIIIQSVEAMRERFDG